MCQSCHFLFKRRWAQARVDGSKPNTRPPWYQGGLVFVNSTGPRIGSILEESVWIQNELLCHARIKLPISNRRLTQGEDRSIDNLVDLQTIMEKGLHQLAVVLEHRSLTCIEPMRLRPSEPEAQLLLARFGSLVVGTGIFRHVQPRYPYASRGTNDRHQRIQDGGRRFLSVLTLRSCFKSNRIEGRVNLWLTDDGRDKFSQIVALCQIDRSESHGFGVLQPRRIHIADHHNGCAENVRGSCCR